MYGFQILAIQRANGYLCDKVPCFSGLTISMIKEGCISDRKMVSKAKGRSIIRKNAKRLYNEFGKGKNEFRATISQLRDMKCDGVLIIPFSRCNIVYLDEFEKKYVH